MKIVYTIDLHVLCVLTAIKQLHAVVISMVFLMSSGLRDGPHRRHVSGCTCNTSRTMIYGVQNGYVCVSLGVSSLPCYLALESQLTSREILQRHYQAKSMFLPGSRVSLA